MSDQRTEVRDWVVKVFAVVGILDAPPHLITYYVEQVISGTLSFQQVQNEVLALSRNTNISNTQTISGDLPTTSTTQSVTIDARPRAPSFGTGNSFPSLSDAQTFADQMIRDEEKAKIQRQIGTEKPSPSSSGSSTDKIRDYVDQLFITFVGRKGDPASTNFLVSSIVDKSYSLTQAEFFVKFSKEAKAYQKTQEKLKETKKTTQMNEYVRELYRVFLKNPNPTNEEVKQYVDLILNGSQTLQDIEDEFRLLSLTPIK